MAPLTVVILVALFAAQSRGTARVAALFGPVMVVWFVAIAIAGGLHIRDDPNVLFAINPLYAISFVSNHGMIGLVTLGAVFLVVTGGEALYADLGHFGRKPIQTAWFCLVCLRSLINYFGQGAKVLADPSAIDNPFYKLVPDFAILPMVVLATAATVIASQAVITGAYSLVHQAIQLGFLPRLAILHTSASHVGQIYIPRVTWALLIGVLLLVGLFRTSSALASRLRHRCRNDDGGGRTACLHRGLEIVAMEIVASVAGYGAAYRGRRDVLLRQRTEACRKAPGLRFCSASPWCS